MTGDFTIGQFFPGNSALHRLDARMKFVLTFVFIALIFCAFNFASLLLIVLFLVFFVMISGILVKTILKSVKPIIPIIIFTAVINAFSVGGRVLLRFWIFKITAEGLSTAAFMSVRVTCLIVASSLLTYTTSPTRLTDAIEKLLTPLKWIRLDVHSLAMMMTIALRFIPTLVEDIEKIMNAQKARGADMESGGLIRRAKALVPVLIPLFVSSIRRAYELAFAMECRCYNGGEGRTSFKQMRLKPRDLAALGVMAMFTGMLVASNIFFKFLSLKP